MDIIGSGTASLDLLFMTTEERTASDATRRLNKLINNVLDHVDDERIPPSLQDLRNATFARGFQAGYREAYRQWGEEADERLDEAYEAGIQDERKEWKGKLTTKPCGEPTKTTHTSTTDAAMQTSLLVTAALSPLPSTSTTLSTATTSTIFSALELLPGPRKRRLSLPSRLTTPQPSVLHPVLRAPTTTSPSTTVTTSIATTAETTIWAKSNTQTTASTSETATWTSRSPKRRSMAVQTTNVDDNQPHTLKKAETPPKSIADATYVPCASEHPQKRSRQRLSPPDASQLAIQQSVTHPSPPSSTATSQATERVHLSPASSKQRTTALQRRHTVSGCRTALPGPPTSPRLVLSLTVRRPEPPPLLAMSQAVPPLPLASPAQERRTMAQGPSETRSDACTTRLESPKRNRATESPTQASATSQPAPQPPPPPPASIRSTTARVPSRTHPNMNIKCSEPPTCDRASTSTTTASATSQTTKHSPSTPHLSERQPTSEKPRHTFPEPTPSSVPPDSAPVRSHFDWAEDAESLPTSSPSARTYEPRDFSCLRSNQPSPFQTIQRRIHRYRTVRRRHRDCRRRDVPNTTPFANNIIFTRSHPSGISLGKPTFTTPFSITSPPTSVPKFDWDRDPHLADLSRALRALGWIPPR